MSKWRPFEEAREYARTLGLTTQKEWHRWSRTEARPHDIPASPHHAYPEYSTIGDWLGTGAIASFMRQFRPYQEAKQYARSLNLPGVVEWRELARTGALPPDIPSTADKVYAGIGWTTWGDFLGTGSVCSRRRTFLGFEAARAKVRAIGIGGSKQYHDFIKNGSGTEGLPSHPDQLYIASGWNGWGDFLGTGVVATHRRVFLPFREARQLASGLGIRTGDDWKNAVLPDGLPRTPHRYYKKKGWVSWGDWLGTGAVACQLRSYRQFDSAREFARDLGLKTGKEWRAWAKSSARPDDIPAIPSTTYRGQGWRNMADWLDSRNRPTVGVVFRPFEEARAFARSLGLRNGDQWARWAKSAARPGDIPFSPAVSYRHTGWVSMGDWLGTGIVASRYFKCRPFEEARMFARSLTFRNRAEWSVWNQRPADIPAAPDQYYKDLGWVSWGDWLGTGAISPRRRRYRPFHEARAYIRSLGFKSEREFKAWASSPDRPLDIPSKPDAVYGRDLDA